MRDSLPRLIVSSVWERPHAYDLAARLRSATKAIQEVSYVYSPDDAVLGAFQIQMDTPGFIALSWGSREMEYYSSMWHLPESGPAICLLAAHSPRRPYIDLPFLHDYTSMVRHHMTHRVRSNWTVEESYDSAADVFRRQQVDIEIPGWVFPAPSIYAEMDRVAFRSHVIAEFIPYRGC